MSRSLRATTILFATFAVAGCASAPRPGPVAAPAPTARFVPPADRYIRSVLLDFESPTDAAFVDAASAKRVMIDPAQATNRVLAADGPASVRLGALVRGRPFPGAWDLVGVRLASPTAGRQTLALYANDAVVASADASLVAGRWRTVWVDLSSLTATSRPTTAIATTSTSTMPADESLTLHVGGPGGVMIDEIVLAQSKIVVAESISPRTGETFRVARAGTVWRATLGGRRLIELPAAPFADEGYRVTESNAARVGFRTSSGDIVTVDRLGRVTRGETANVPGIVIVDGAARIDRDQPGDRDNDGFDDSRGCYTIRASGSRFTFRIDGSSAAPVSWPTVDVVGLAEGAVSVWVEGQVVPSVTRTSDDVTTIELPLDVRRPITVQVRVRE